MSDWKDIWRDDFEKMRTKRILLDVAGTEALEKAEKYFKENPESLLMKFRIIKKNEEGSYIFRINKRLEIEEYKETGDK